MKAQYRKDMYVGSLLPPTYGTESTYTQQYPRFTPTDANTTTNTHSKTNTRHRHYHLH